MYAKTRNCSFLLPDVYSLRLLAYKDLLPRLATLLSVLITILRSQVEVVVVALENTTKSHLTIHVSVLSSLP